MSAHVSLIAALAQNGTIGLEGGMPWHISADLRYFKSVTTGAPIIMGRKTYISIGAALPGRANIVITRNLKLSIPDADVVNNLNLAISKALALAEINGNKEVFVIGGAEIYRQALNLADKLYLTEIHANYPGDAFFPCLETEIWREESRTLNPPEVNGGPAFSFVVYTRIA